MASSSTSSSDGSTSAPTSLQSLSSSTSQSSSSTSTSLPSSSSTSLISTSTNETSASASTSSIPTTESSPSAVDTAVTSTTFATLTSTITSIVTSTTVTTIPTTITTQVAIATNDAPPIEDKPDGGLSPLAVAGVGIGAGIGGGMLALLALGILFYLYRRRRRTLQQVQPTSTQRWTEDNDATDVLSVSTAMAPIPERKPSTIDRQTTNGTSIGIELLTPLSDHQLASLLIGLKTRIKTHVEFFYTTVVDATSTKPTGWISSFELLSSAIGSEAPFDAGAMDALLQEPRTRILATRMLIAWMIMRNVEIDAPLDRTLLPPELVRVLESLDPQTDDLSLAHSQTRHTTASLLSPIYTAVPTSPSLDLDARDPRRHNIGELTTTIHQILQPYARTGLGAPRAKDLASVVSQGAQFGYTLFSQPTTWKLDWCAVGRQSDEIVSFPALVKVGDGRGQKLKKQVVICEAEVTRLGMKA